MSKHTPGPWGIMKGDHGPMIFSGECGRAVAMLARQVTTAEREANARLIAAAPELLEALEVMLNGDEMGEYECQRTGFPRMIQRREKARAAIAKAKGEK